MSETFEWELIRHLEGLYLMVKSVISVVQGDSNYLYADNKSQI